jgi:hypothetical protein
LVDAEADGHLGHTGRMVIHQSGMRPGEAERVLPCDGELPGAAIVIDRATTLPATPEVVWPWLTQIGKDRGGWYFPRWFERGIPAAHRGATTLRASYGSLTVGEKVLDWGPGVPQLEAIVVDEPHDIGYRSTRGRTHLTWELNLTPDGPAASRLHLRLRIDRRRDWATPAVVYLGGLFDWLTVIALFAGLKERLTP